METRPFGNTGIRIPVIGQGTWDLEKAPRERAIAALRRGIDLGMTHIDTAEMYGTGRVEEIVGEAIAGRRDRVFLVSKVLPSNATFDGTIQACERSLRHLKTDRLDVYLLHWRSGEPLAETFRAFEKLQRDGKIRAFGVSNFDVEDLEEAVRIAGEGKIACNQVLYHLKERAIEHKVIPWCERHGIAVVAYSPFGQGNFPAFSRQAALAFLVRRPSIFAIPKAARIEHVEENAAAGDLRLSEEEIARIDAAFPLGSKKSLPML